LAEENELCLPMSKAAKINPDKTQIKPSPGTDWQTYLGFIRENLRLGTSRLYLRRKWGSYFA